MGLTSSRPLYLFLPSQDILLPIAGWLVKKSWNIPSMDEIPSIFMDDLDDN
jgi:hypothetical protein